MQLRVLLFVAIGLVTQHGAAAAQTFTGTLAGVVRDAQGRLVEGATVRMTSPAASAFHSTTSACTYGGTV